MYHTFLEIFIVILLVALFYCLWKLGKNRSLRFFPHSKFGRTKEGEEDGWKLLHVIEQYPVSVVIADSEGIVEYVNPRFSEMTGYRSHEMPGKHLEFLARGCGDETLFDEMWTTVRSGESWKGEFCKEEKGKKCWAFMSIAPVRSIDGPVSNYIAIMEDITAGKEMALEIDRNRKIQVILNKILNISLEDLPLNEQLRRSLEVIMEGPFDGLGKSAAIMLADNENSELRLAAHVELSENIIEKCGTVPFGSCICGKVAESEELVPFDCAVNMEIMRAPDYLPEGGYGIPVRSVRGLLAVMSVHVGKGAESDEKEITFLRLAATTLAAVIEKKRGEEALQAARVEAVSANLAKSDFLANMSHEFRTPLNAVIGFSEMLILGVGGDLNEKQIEFVKDIYEGGEHLLSLINDILDLNKVESGKLDLDYSSVNMQDLIKKSFLFIRQCSENKGLTLSCQVGEGVGPVYCDERRIKQVLLNLLTNAVKFTEKGKIVVCASLKEKGAVMQVSVEDTGIGIKAEDLLMLFQPFSQVEGGYARKNEGSGLGLALCKNIINSHGGEIRAESTFGKGSRFIFTLPVKHEGLHEDKCISLAGE
ncbi:MAG: ATP-binding protein [Deltaproteobacteria bacterium]|nr:ATP-binding protein [Deltaproteobacteria bacterium]